MLRVPKSLLVSQAVELCRRVRNRMLVVADVIDESFTPASRPLQPGPIIGFAVPVDYASGKVDATAMSIPASCRARPSSSVAITVVGETPTARLASVRSFDSRSDRL